MLFAEGNIVTRCVVLTVGTILFLAVGLVPCGGALIFTVSTGRSSYLIGDLIDIAITAQNTGNQSTTLVFPSDHQSSYCIDGIYDWDNAHSSRLPIVTYQTLPAYGTHTWTMTHGNLYSQGYPLGVGLHSVTGEILGYGISGPVEFSVVPEPITASLLALGGIFLRRCGRNCRIRRQG
jgi:hypothetical protein